MTIEEYEKIYQDFIQEMKESFEELPRRAEINAIISNFSSIDISGTVLTRRAEVLLTEDGLPLEERISRDISHIEGEVTPMAINGIVINNIKPIVVGFMSAGMAQQLEELNFAESNIPEEHIELIELFISQKSNQMIAEYLSSFIEMNKDCTESLQCPAVEPYVINSFFFGDIFGKDYAKYSRFDLECNTNLCNNYERLHQWWCQGERTSSIFLMR
jgi:hypothetical protein